MTMKFLPALSWLTLALVSTGCSGVSQVDVGRVLTSGRDGWQHPERVVEALAITPGDRVAEIGSGSGYWLTWLSEAVGSAGRVYAVEVDEELVADLLSFVEKEGLRNVEVILGAYDDPRLPDASIDLALTVLTYHHIEGRVDYFGRPRTDLRRGGRVAHLDDRPDATAPFSWFQSESHWTAPSLVVEEMAGAGYQRLSEFDFLPVQSFQIFRPETSQEASRVSELNDSPEEGVGS